MRLRRGPTASGDFDKYCESCEVKIRQTFGENFKGDGKMGPLESDDFDAYNEFGEDFSLYKENLL